MPGRFELPCVERVQYFAYADPSSGRQDSFTLGIAHAEKSGKIVLDVLRERRPPFQPKAAVAEFSDVLKSFKIAEVTADKYAIGYVDAAFREHGITVRNSERTAELLDLRRLAGQLTRLERRTRAGGKDLVTHYPGGHDDVCNSAAGAWP